ncbi:MAG: histidinol dehydrogenase, partial [Chitinophagaceae bacterium]
MMKMYSYPDKKIWPEIIKRPVADNSSLEKSVKKILQKVKEKGDKAVIKFTRQFDEVKLKNSTITSHEIMAAEVLLSDALKQAIQQAKINIERFHISQKEEVKKIETMPGVICWRQSVGIEKVGLYIPGGSAPLFSTVLMLAIPAQIAGSKEIILCTPPQMDGTINPAILYTANLCGITKIFKVGGVQAIAAMAYGTESIPKVFKIFGPGNQYVTLAKQLVQQEGLAIDMPAGPSEVLIIADEGAIPEYVAADLLSQAEHGADSQVMLVTYSLSLVDGVKNEIEKQLSTLSRKKIAIKA